MKQGFHHEIEDEPMIEITGTHGDYVNVSNYCEPAQLGLILNLNSHRKPTIQELHAVLSSENPEKFCRILYCFGFHDVGITYDAQTEYPHDINLPQRVILHHVEMTEDYDRELIHAITIMQAIDHPDMVRLHGSYLPNDKDLWIMSTCISGTVLESMVSYIPLQEHVVANICRALCSCLQHLHSKSIVYRRMCCSSVGVSLEGKTVLMTLTGCVKLSGQKCPSVRAFGKPAWLAPEIPAGKGFGKSADIWSLGITVLEMVARNHPYFGITTMQGMLDYILKWGPPQLHPHQFSQELGDFLSKCLCVSENDRASAAELLKHEFLRKSCSDDRLAALVRMSPRKGHQRS